MTAERHSYAPNPNVQWWVPCVDPAQANPILGPPVSETRHASPPSNWPRILIDRLDEVREQHVGRALLRHATRRTTVYFADATAQADVDRFDDQGAGLSGAEVSRRLAASGMRARVSYDPRGTANVNRHGLIKARDISLAHEFAHVVGITHGVYPRATDATFARVYDAPSEAEGHALVLENMYRSELRLTLRRTYLGDEPRWSERSPAPASLHDLEELTVEAFRRGAAGFVSELERLEPHRVPYNPFRDLRGQTLVRRSSRGGRLQR